MAEPLVNILRKPKILIAEDEEINREILGMILEDKYDIDFATNGKEALFMLYNNNYVLLLLDLVMPEVSGIDVLRKMESDPDLKRIPVIVLTGEKSLEVECLKLGAMDFLRKPYESQEIIRARVERVVELFEDREMINKVHEDSLTGLLSKGFFVQYVIQFIESSKEKMDMISININDFQLINEMNGMEFGDNVLKEIANVIKEVFDSLGAISTRDISDNFIVFTPHLEDYSAFVKKLQKRLNVLHSDIDIRFRVGVCEYTGKESAEILINRSRFAMNTIKKDYSRNIAFYDEALHEKDLYRQRLINDFHNALENNQFRVYFQPKYSIKEEKPKLVGAEALIRWIHPKYGFVSPGEFIPLFEENGMIKELDHFVYKKTGEVIKRINELHGKDIAISVNVSRIDLFDPSLEPWLLSIVKDNNIPVNQLHLEVTESAYTDNPNQLIQIVHSLKDKGFVIEMDDFGTGYSSLNMLSDLQFDILKLDMMFIRNMHKSERNEAVIKLIIGIAKLLNASVIAEGVETKEQVDALKGFGCDIIQGYYFSKPLPEKEFIDLVIKELE